MLCRCLSYLKKIKTRNTPTLNGGEDGGVWILLFSELTLFECNNFIADCGLVFNLLKCHRHIEFISPLSEAFPTDHLWFNICCLRIVVIMATAYLFKWAAWNFHRSCKWADFVVVSIGHKIKEKELKHGFHMSGNSYTIGILLFARLSPILQILNLAGNGKCVKNWNLRDRGTGAERDEKTVEEKNRIVSWFHFIFILLFSSCCSTFTPSATLLSEYLEQVILLPKILVQIVSSRLREVSYRRGLQSRWDKIETGFKRKHKKRQTASSQGKQS